MPSGNPYYMLSPGNESGVGDRVEFFVPIGPADTDLAAQTYNGATFRPDFDIDVDDFYASVVTAPTGSGITIDVNDDGTTMLSTKLTIDATEKDSSTAASAFAISGGSPWSLAANSEVTFDVDAIGSTVAGQNLTVKLGGIRRS